MTGVSYLVDDDGKKTAVILDIRKHRRIWEDVYARLLIDSLPPESPAIGTLRRIWPPSIATSTKPCWGWVSMMRPIATRS